MATIKAFSDLEQSKKLAKILPIESADMCIGNYVGKSGKVDGTNIHYYPKGESFGAPEIIDAWSLAGLLNVIPKEIFNGDFIINITEGIDNKWIITYNAHNSGSFYGLVASAYNLVDACVDIIERLHERKML